MTTEDATRGSPADHAARLSARAGETTLCLDSWAAAEMLAAR